MLELEGRAFLGAVTQLRALIVAIGNIQERSGNVPPSDRTAVLDHVTNLIAELTKIRSRSALAAADRLHGRLLDTNDQMTYGALQTAMSDIESRFADHLADIKLFVMSEGEAALFEPADNLLAFSGAPVTGFSLAFPTASFEIEEAAKCMALSRHTASVFHCMRAVECGIRALAAFLQIPDPTKPTDKNWGIILGKIKDQIDSKWPKSSAFLTPKGLRWSFFTLNWTR